MQSFAEKLGVVCCCLILCTIFSTPYKARRNVVLASPPCEQPVLVQKTVSFRWIVYPVAEVTFGGRIGGEWANTTVHRSFFFGRGLNIFWE